MKNSVISFQKLFSFLVYLYIFGRIIWKRELRLVSKVKRHKLDNK